MKENIVARFRLLILHDSADTQTASINWIKLFTLNLFLVNILQGVMEDLPSCNNKWNVTTTGIEQQLARNPPKPQKPNHPQPEFFLQNWYSTSQFISLSSTSVTPYPPIFSLFFLGRPCCDKAQQNGRKTKKGRSEGKYCCTIPFTKFARFHWHLNRLNKLNKNIDPKLIFSKYLKL